MLIEKGCKWGVKQVKRLLWPVLLACLLVQWPVSGNAVDHTLTKVSLQLIWKHQFQFAGYYVAQEKGFYKDAGLEVDIRKFEGTDDFSHDIMSGKLDFAVGRSSILIDQTKGSELVGLFAAFQQSPLMLLTKASSNIRSPADLKNKNIMLTDDAALVAEVRAMLLQSGLVDKSYSRQLHSFNIDDLINGNTDAMGSYVSNEPFQMQNKGIDYHVIHPKDYGFEVYSDILYTSRQFLDSSPALTARFYAASIKGWRYAFNHIEETVDIILEKYNSQNKSREALLFEANALKKLAFDEDEEFGTLSAAKLQDIAQMYLVFGLLDKNYNVDSFIYKGYAKVSHLGLSLTEMKYLHDKREITVCVGPNRMPYEKIIKGKHIGMTADYMALFSERLDIPITLVPTGSWHQSLEYVLQKKCDILSAAMATEQRRQSFKFTIPYFETPFAIAVPDNASSIIGVDDLRGKKLAIVKGCAIPDLLPEKTSKAQFLTVDNKLEGLRLVQQGKVDGYIGPLAVLSHTIQSHQMTDIKIIGLMEKYWRASIAVHKDAEILQDILNKAVSSLTEIDRQRLTNKWINIKYEHNVDYTMLWQVLGVMLVIVGLLLYRYKIISAYSKQLEVLAEHDKLTGIFNRHKTDALLQNLIEVARRYDRALSLIYFDIDHFKRINDTYGHEAGDCVLIELASIVSKQTRKSDVFGRWGGEEFLVVLPETNINSAADYAEALREKVGTYSFSVGETITCSFGVTEFNAEDTVDNFVKRADGALYKAKDSGRDCIKVSRLVTPNS